MFTKLYCNAPSSGILSPKCLQLKRLTTGCDIMKQATTAIRYGGPWHNVWAKVKRTVSLFFFPPDKVKGWWEQLAVCPSAFVSSLMLVACSLYIFCIPSNFCLCISNFFVFCPCEVKVNSSSTPCVCYEITCCPSCLSLCSSSFWGLCDFLAVGLSPHLS
jgi:hypothetical protein